MTVDATARNFSVTITVLDTDRNNIGGPYDLSEAISAAKVNIAGLNLQGPNGGSPWTAELILENGITVQNIDARDVAASPAGASLLAQGNAVDLRIFDGGSFKRGWPTLYILRVPSPIDPLSAGEQNTTIELGDITQLENTAQPEGNLSGMTLGTSYSRHTIANNILAARNLPTSTDTISSYPLSVPTQKLGTNAWPNEIGRLAGTAGYFFWIDKDDNARFTAIDLNKSTPDFTLTTGIDEVGRDGWKRVNLSERPPAKLVVTGTGGRAIAKANPEVITTVSSEKETTFTRTISVLSNQVTEVYEERLSERTILPRIPTQGSSGGESTVTSYTINTSTALRVARRQTVVEDYSSSTKELRTSRRTVKVARAMAGGNAYDEKTDSVSDAYDLLGVESTTITYRYSDGRMSDRETRTQRPWALVRWANVRPNNYGSNRFLVQTNLTKEESWAKRLLIGQDWKYEYETRRPQGELDTYYGAAINAEVMRQSPSESDTVESNEDGPARPPSTKYMPLLYGQDNQQYEGSIDITPLAGRAHKNRLRTVAIQGPYVVSSAQCEFLAEIIGRLEHGLSLGQQFTGAIPQWIIDSFAPGARVDITDGGVVKSYFLNGWTIAADATETLWGCSLAELGTVGATPGDVTPPITVTYPVVHSVTAPSPVFAASASLALNARHTVVAPSPIFSAQVSGTGDVSHAVTAPSPVFAANASEGDDDANTLVGRLVGTYSQAELSAIDDLFVGLKADGLYSKIPAMWVYALDSSTDASLNWVSTSFTATPTNMTFTARQGFAGNGSTSYIGTGFIPSSESSVGQNNTAVSVYVRSRSAGVFNDFGGRTGSGQPLVSIRLNATGQTPLSSINADTSPVGITSSSITGMQTLSRTTSTLQTLYRNGVSEGTLPQTSDGEPTTEMYVAGFNNSGSVAASSDGQYAFAAITEGLDATEAADFNSRITTLLTVFGANV